MRTTLYRLPWLPLLSMMLMLGPLREHVGAQPSVRNNAPAAPARAAGRIAVRAMSESRNLKER
jgi:hypothetical protein